MTTPTHTQADLDAAVAAALEGAAGAMMPVLRSMISRGEAHNIIRALIQQPARAALAAMLKAEREKALDEAAGRIAELLTLGFSEAARDYNTGVGVAHDAILALKGASHD